MKEMNHIISYIYDQLTLASGSDRKDFFSEGKHTHLLMIT